MQYHMIGVNLLFLTYSYQHLFEGGPWNPPTMTKIALDYPIHVPNRFWILLIFVFKLRGDRYIIQYGLKVSYTLLNLFTLTHILIRLMTKYFIDRGNFCSIMIIFKFYSDKTGWGSPPKVKNNFYCVYIILQVWVVSIIKKFVTNLIKNVIGWKVT